AERSGLPRDWAAWPLCCWAPSAGPPIIFTGGRDSTDLPAAARRPLIIGSRTLPHGAPSGALCLSSPVPTERSLHANPSAVAARARVSSVAAALRLYLACQYLWPDAGPDHPDGHRRGLHRRLRCLCRGTEGCGFSERSSSAESRDGRQDQGDP